MKIFYLRQKSSHVSVKQYIYQLNVASFITPKAARILLFLYQTLIWELTDTVALHTQVHIKSEIKAVRLAIKHV